MKTYLQMIGMLLCFCSCVDRYEAPCNPTYDDAISVALDAWFEVMGGVLTNRCATDLDEFVIVDVATLDSRCSTYASGCIIPVEKKIEILSSNDSYIRGTTLIHEIIHLMNRCVFGSIDPQHANDYLWNEYGYNSVESIANHSICDAE